MLEEQRKGRKEEGITNIAFNERVDVGHDGRSLDIHQGEGRCYRFPGRIERWGGRDFSCGRGSKGEAGEEGEGRK
jgi:hypothetical protein